MLFGVVFPSSTINTVFPKLSPSENVLVGLKYVVDLLNEVQSVLNQTVDARSTNLTLQTSMEENHPPPGYGILRDSMNGSSVLLSKLASVYWMTLNADLPMHIHIADYCLAKTEAMVDW